MTKTLTEQVLNLQKMVEDECSRRCKLEEQLRIAINALEEIPDLLGNNDDYGALCCVTDALQEMEGVK